MELKEKDSHSIPVGDVLSVPKGYKKTEVGLIPEDWEIVKLGEIADIMTGSTPSTRDKTNYGSDYLFVSPADLGKSKVIEETEKKLSVKGFSLARKFPRNSILFTCIGSTIGKSGIAMQELTSNQQINAVLPNGSYNTDYVFYALSKISKHIKSQAGEQAVPLINKTEFSEFQIPLPPTLAEQEVIATALSDVDTTISALDKLIAKKKAIKQGAMQQLLTPPHLGGKRLPGFTGDWVEKKLGEVCLKIVGGGTPSRGNKHYWNGLIPWCTVKDYATYSPMETQEYITEKGLSESSSNLIPAGTLITPTRMLLGKILWYEVDVAINQDLKALELNSLIDKTYLYYLFSTIAKQIQDIGSGSTVKGISLGDLRNQKISFPLNIKEQQAIATILSDMDTELEQLQRKKAKYQQLKQGMMQELLTGKTRLV